MNDNNDITYKDIPANVAAWQLDRINSGRKAITDPERVAVQADGTLRWKSNNALIPTFVFKDAHAEPPTGQVDAYDTELTATLQRYRERRAKHPRTAEELFEMRAAFGPGATVVDIITGEKIRT